MAHYVFLTFNIILDNSNIEKLIEVFFPGKFIFGPNLGKNVQNGSKIGIWGFFEKFGMLVFLGNNL